jgi:hypothetical protein
MPRRSLVHDPGVRQRLIDGAEKGLPIKTCCDLAGISERVYYQWAKRAERGHKADQPYAQLFQDLTRARGEFTEGLVANIQIAGHEPKTWQANAWLLERRNPAEFGQTINVRVRTEVAKELGQFLVACREALTDREWAKVRRVAESMESSPGPGRGSTASPTRH